MLSQFPLQEQNSVEIVSCLIHRHHFEHLTVHSQWTVKYSAIVHLTFSGKSKPSYSFHLNWRESLLKLDKRFAFKWTTYVHRLRCPYSVRDWS